MEIHEQLLSSIDNNIDNRIYVDCQYRANWAACNCGGWRFINRSDLEGRLFTVGRSHQGRYRIEFLDCINMKIIKGRDHNSMYVEVRYPTNEIIVGV